MKTLLSLTMLISLVFGQFSAPIASPFAQDVDATPTATQDVTETPVSEPTVSETPTVESTLTPADNETLTVEPTDTPTETPIPIAETATPAPTITSTETPLSSIAVEAPILSLSANPDFITPGGKLMLSWKIEGLSSLEKDSLVLQITIPDGFTLQDRADGKFDETSRLLTISVNALGGQVQLRTRETISDAVFFAVLMQGAETLATAELSVPVQGQFNLDRSGGVINALDGKVKVTFPDGALPEDAIIRAGFPAADSLPEDYYSQHAFELKAFGKAKNTKIERFNRKLTIEVDYSDLDLTEEQEGQLYLYWYNPETGDWHALESFPDPETKTLRALTDHFTVFDIGINDWRAERLPTTESFQVSKFTGAGTFSLPIEVPPGPGGFQPSVTLSYNSQVVDQATTKAQASWVGMGWSLDGGGGSITENGDGNGYMLVVNGVSTELIREEEGGRFHTVDENFWKIKRDGAADTWTIYDTQGSVYFFGRTAQYSYNDGSGYQPKTYAWYLTSATNPHGQVMTYDYWVPWHGRVGGVRTDTAVYLSTITYAGGRTRVRFAREDRTDYTLAYDTDDAVHMYETKRLNNIVVEQDSDGNGDFDTQIRKYEFIYIDEEEVVGTDGIWPGKTYSAGGQATTLRSVQEWGGWNGTEWVNSLPPHTFQYDNLHLVSANNGYGGLVEFTYESEPWYHTVAPGSYVVNDSDCSTGWNHFNTSTCNSSTHEMTVVNGTTSKNILNTTSKNLMRPGGVYQVIFTGSKTASSIINVGLTHTSSNADRQVGANNQFSAIISPFDKTASAARVLFVVSGGSNGTNGTGKFTSVKVKLLPSFYRVTTKTVKDGNEHSYVTGYTYESPLVAGDHEFRGHQYVTETAPDGTKIKTTYYQDDAKKGRTQKTEVYAPNSLTLISESINLYEATLLPEYPEVSEFQHAWVHLTYEKNRIYDASGVLVGGTYTSYAYDDTYGNLIEKKEYGNSAGTGAPYRISTTTYTTPKNSSTIYIVSAPARQQVQDGSGNILADTLYFYNYSTTNGAAPAKNILTMARTLVDGAQGKYAQVDYVYDSYGNRTSATTYTEYGTASTAPTVGAQTTNTAYDSIFNTYPVSISNGIVNGVLHQTTLDYSAIAVPGTTLAGYALGVPVSETDANGATTTAEYDTFGRIKNLFSPDPITGQPETTANLTMEYSDDASVPFAFPFKTTITLTAMDYSVIRQYDGMGRETRSIANGIYTDTEYDSPTQTRQSMPYDPDTESPQYTTTVTTPATRTTTVTAPDGSTATSTSNGLTTIMTDAKGNSTSTVTDVWGRTSNVIPPTGPSLSYQYDALGNLLTATRSGEAPASPPPANTLLNGLTGWWSMNETSGTRFDSQGVNHLKDNNTVTSAAGKQGNAAKFVTANAEYLSIADKPEISAGDIDFTLIAHVYLNNNTNTFVIINKGEIGSTAPMDYRLAYSPNSGFGFRVGPNGGAQLPHVNSETISAGIWHLVIAWHDSVNDTLNIQVDNGAVNSAPYSGGASDTANSLSMGAYPDGSLGLNGRIDEAALYKRILTSEERTWLYNSGLGRSYAELFPADAPSNPPVSASVTTLTYDNAGRKTSMTDPDMGSWTYTYDALGNLDTQTDARGCTLDLDYDALNRLLTKKSNNDGDCVTQVDTLYTYDIGDNALGRRTEAKNTLDNIVSSWTYDKRGQVTSETVMGYTTEFGYNNAGMPVTMKYSDGETVAYDYTDRMLLESLTGTLGSVTTSYATLMDYDSAGRMIERTLGNGLTQAFDYYNWDEKVNDVGQGGRLQTLLTGTLQDLNYIYDAGGNIKEIRDDIATETSAYGYDALDRLTSWNLNGTPETYTYDSATGNLDVKAGVDLNYNDASHVHAATHIGSTQRYWYDANGNQITRVIGADTFNLIYDAENRLVEAKKNSLTIAEFIYDGDGRRVKATNDGETILFIGSHFEFNDTTGEVTKYYRAGAQTVAMRKVLVPQYDTLTYLIGDHLGSTSLATDATGNLVTETRYKPWGEVRYTTQNSTLPTRYTYTGQYSYMDDETTDLGGAGFDLMFYNARWYDPYLNHFTQPDSIVPDPYNPQDWNRYSYARNNPLKYTDPTGHKPVCDGGAGEVCKPSYSIKDKINDTIINIKNKFDWTVKGKGWTLKEVETIFQTGNDILAYANDVTGGNGLDWMHAALGNTTIEHVGFADGHSDAWPTLSGPRIRLDENWLNDPWGASVVFAHELGHVWDINSGLTNSGEMNRNLGGSSWCFICAPGDVPQWDPFYHRHNGDAYGNSARNEYFAEAFAAGVYSPGIVPAGASEWMRLQMLQDVVRYLFPGGLQ